MQQLNMKNIPMIFSQANHYSDITTAIPTNKETKSKFINKPEVVFGENGKLK